MTVLLESSRVPHSLKGIKAGIRRYFRKHGKAPSVLSGDASPYVEYKTTWSAINGFLRNHGPGSLAAVNRDLGLGVVADHDLDAIKAGVESYVGKHGEAPSQRSGDATKYTGYRTNWRSIDMWLRRRGLKLSSVLTDRERAKRV